MELTTTEKNLIVQAINTHLKALEELGFMAEGFCMAKQAVINETVVYKKLKTKIGA